MASQRVGHPGREAVRRAQCRSVTKTVTRLHDFSSWAVRTIDQSLRLWALPKGVRRTKPLVNGDGAGEMAISPNGKALVTGTRLWNVATG